ncbi:ArsB/NhaD family transporter [Longivirga aurantiaca]|uniref:SLC13 family permease n=1 Tax=Longivirga aurantiaca TaxID=1837743 RepID=A0ABW1T2C3_9ACTN
MTPIAWAAVGLFVGVYILIATERIHRVAAALGGAALVLGFGVVRSEEAFYSRETGIDWDVIFLLLGMMLVVGVIRRTGVFEFLAIRSAKLARGRPYRVLVLLVLVTAGASALLDNVTTVLLVAPVTLLVCDRLGLNPVPFLIAEALASNIGGTATLVGDPPNIIIASRAGLTFADFLVHLAPIVLVILGAFLLLARFLFRSALVGDPTRADALMALDEREAITDHRLLRRSGVVLALILVGFLLQRQTGVAPSVVAIVGAGVLILLSPLRPQDLVADVEWETLLFFMGLFVLVGALVHVGALEALADVVARTTGGEVGPTLTLMLVASAVISAVVDNIPYVAAMSPVVESLVTTYPALGQDGALWWALALGADLGGNATLVGASANVVIVGIAARNGLHISFVQWLKYGVPTAAMSIAICVPYLLLRYA